MLDGNTLDAARKVDFPVRLVTGNAVDRRTLIRGEIAIPAKLLKHGHGELGITVLDLGSDRIGAFGKKVVTFMLDPETGTEAETAFGDRLVCVVKQRCARMTHFGRAPARPRKTVVVTINLTTNSLQRCLVEDVLVRHVRLHALRRLAGVADRPHALVEFAGHVFDQRLIIVHRDVAEHAVSKAQLLGELIDDGVVRQRVEGRLDDLFTPLQRAV